jgi:hypothetical protein
VVGRPLCGSRSRPARVDDLEDGHAVIEGFLLAGIELQRTHAARIRAL